jgi:hypothetical protein
MFSQLTPKRLEAIGVALGGAATALCCAFTGGCQPWHQLNQNTLGQGSTVAPLMETMAVENLVLFYVNPDAVPSQIAISGGSVATTDQTSIGANDPVNVGVTRVIAATTSVTKSLASNTLSPSLNNQQNQNWTIETITDPDKLGRLTALYRYVTVPGANLCKEYPEVMIPAGAPVNDSGNINQADASTWSAVTQADTIDAYETYRKIFPRGQHFAAAALREHQIERGIPESKDEDDWASALKTDTAGSYGNYLKQHLKDGHHVSAARDRLDSLIAAAAPKKKRASPDFVPDESLLTEPNCIKCSSKANLGNSSALGPARGVGYCPGSKDIYINRRLVDKFWLAIVPAGTAMSGFVPIGSARGFDAYTDRPAAWHHFVLAVQQAMETGSGVTGGKVTTTTPGKPKITTFVLPAQPVPLLQ